MDRNNVAEEALNRALQSPSMSNYPAIYAGFEAKGIRADEIKPRENVFSFHAWKALGRSVRKGEHGVRIATVRKGERTDKETGEKVAFSSPWHVTVFHISQTDLIAAAGAERHAAHDRVQARQGAQNTPEYSEEFTRHV